MSRVTHQIVEIIDHYVRPYAGAIGIYFFLVDNNAGRHRSGAVEVNMENHSLEIMELTAHSPDPNLIEHLRDYAVRQVSALTGFVNIMII